MAGLFAKIVTVTSSGFFIETKKSYHNLCVQAQTEFYNIVLHT